MRVDAHTGAVRLVVRDVPCDWPLPIAFTRHYDSRRELAGVFGSGWASWLDEAVVCIAGEQWLWTDGHGRTRELLPLSYDAIPPRGGTVRSPVLVGDARGRLALLQGAIRTSLVQDPDSSDTWRPERIACGESWSAVFTREGRRATGLKTSWGPTLTLDYTDEGHVAVIAVSSGSASRTVATYRYEAGRRLVEYRDGAGGRVRYLYDDGLLVTVRASTGSSRFAAYDGTRRCVALWAGDSGAARRLSWDLVRNQILITDDRGARTVFRDDPAIGITEWTDGDGRRRVWQVVPDGSLATESVDDRATWVVLSPEADVRELVDGTGAHWRFEYTAGRALARLEDPLRHVWRWEYDDRDRPVRRLDPSGAETRWTWLGRHAFEIAEPSGRVLRIQLAPDLSTLTATDAVGVVARLEFDHCGRLVRGTADDALELVITRDDAGHVTRVEGPGPGVDTAASSAERGETNRVEESTPPVDTESRFSFDALGRLVTATASDLSIDWTYDDDGLLAEERYDGRAVRYHYDGAGRLRSLEPPSTVTWLATRDTRGRVIALDDPELGTFGFGYGPGCRLSSIRYPNGTEVLYRAGAIVVRRGPGEDVLGSVAATPVHPVDMPLVGLLGHVLGETIGHGTAEHAADGRLAAWLVGDRRVALEYADAGRLIGLVDRERHVGLVVDFAGRLLHVRDSEHERLILWAGRRPLEAHDDAGLVTRWLHHPDLGLPLAEVGRDVARMYAPTLDGAVFGIVDDGGAVTPDRREGLRPLATPALLLAGTSDVVFSPSRTARGVPEPGPHRLVVRFDPDLLLERRTTVLSLPPAADSRDALGPADLSAILDELCDRQPRSRPPDGVSIDWPAIGLETLAALARGVPER